MFARCNTQGYRSTLWGLLFDVRRGAPRVTSSTSAPLRRHYDIKPIPSHLHHAEHDNSGV